MGGRSSLLCISDPPQAFVSQPFTNKRSAPHPPRSAASLALGFCLAVALTLTLTLGVATPLAAQDKGPPDANAKQDGKIWGALFFATDTAVEEATEGPAKAITERLRKAFAEAHFQLLGEHAQAIFSEYESWVVPSKDLFLKIDSKGPVEEGEGMNLHLQLWREKNVLLKTDVVLRKSPIFIRGPKWGDGYLIMVIELR